MHIRMISEGSCDTEDIIIENTKKSGKDLLAHSAI